MAKGNKESYGFTKWMFCSLCSKKLKIKKSHNALPLSKRRCCEKCNASKVIPARLEIFYSNKDVLT